MRSNIRKRKATPPLQTRSASARKANKDDGSGTAAAPIPLDDTETPARSPRRRRLSPDPIDEEEDELPSRSNEPQSPRLTTSDVEELLDASKVSIKTRLSVKLTAVSVPPSIGSELRRDKPGS
jgi:hypothetical protein